jgi:hypothetical protein
MRKPSMLPRIASTIPLTSVMWDTSLGVYAGRPHGWRNAWGKLSLDGGNICGIAGSIATSLLWNQRRQRKKFGVLKEKLPFQEYGISSPAKMRKATPSDRSLRVLWP